MLDEGETLSEVLGEEDEESDVDTPEGEVWGPWIYRSDHPIQVVKRSDPEEYQARVMGRTGLSAWGDSPEQAVARLDYILAELRDQTGPIRVYRYPPEAP